MLVCLDKETFKTYDYFENFNYVTKFDKFIVNEDLNLPRYFRLYHEKPPRNETVTFLKMSFSPVADNLVYEYLIGDELNHFSQTPNTIMTLGISRMEPNDFDFIQQNEDNLNVHDLKTKVKKISSKEKITQAGVGVFNHTALHFAGTKTLRTLENYLIYRDKYKSAHDSFWRTFFAPTLFQIYSFLKIYQNLFIHYNLQPYNVVLNDIPDNYFNFQYFFKQTKILEFKTMYLVKILDYSKSVIINYSDRIIDKVKELDPEMQGDSVGYHEIKINVNRGIDKSKDLSLIKKILPLIDNKPIPQHLKEILHRVDSNYKGRDKIDSVDKMYNNLLAYFEDNRTDTYIPKKNKPYGTFVIKTDIPKSYDKLKQQTYFENMKYYFVRGR